MCAFSNEVMGQKTEGDAPSARLRCLTIINGKRVGKYHTYIHNVFKNNNGKRIGTSSYVCHTSSISGVYKRGIWQYFL